MIEEKKINKLYLESFHIENNAKLLPFANFMMPINYQQGIISEHINTRSNCGLFDVSHMLQLEIEVNNENIKALQKVIPLDFNDIKIGKSYYSFILNNEGGIIDDLIISKLLDKNKTPYFYLVLNASRRDEDLKILNKIINNQNKNIRERTDYNLLAIQGPKSRSIIKDVLPNISNLNFMEIESFNYDKTINLISCSGYTGEDGFEISIHKSVVEKFIRKIMNYKDVTLCGLGARDTLRLEAGLCLYGNELNEKTTPLEANLMWTIPKTRLNNKDFVGADKILNDTNSNKKIRIGLKSKSKLIPRSNFDVFNNQNKLIGRITSGSFSPSLKLPIAMAIVDSNFTELNSEIYFKVRSKMESANICNIPFISHKYKQRGVI